MSKVQVQDVIVDRIVKALEQGIIPWRKPWNASGLVPQSIDGHEYRGINYFLTVLSDYTDPRWLTFKKAVALGGGIKKGEHGTPIVYWNFLEKVQDDGEVKKIPFMRYYTVFNVEQTENCNIPSLNVETFDWNPLEKAEQIVAGMPNCPVIRDGNRAAYSPATDTITIPPRNLFRVAEEYYSTLFHEMGHSTGHSKRIGRDGIVHLTGFGTHEYGKEELIAEMVAAFLCGQSGISPAVIENQTAYIGGWMKRIKEDPRMVIQAAQAAQKAVDYITAAAEEAEEAAA